MAFGMASELRLSLVMILTIASRSLQPRSSRGQQDVIPLLCSARLSHGITTDVDHAVQVPQEVHCQRVHVSLSQFVNSMFNLFFVVVSILPVTMKRFQMESSVTSGSHYSPSLLFDVQYQQCFQLCSCRIFVYFSKDFNVRNSGQESLR